MVEPNMLVACFPKGTFRALAESRCSCQQLLRIAVFKGALSLSTDSTLEWVSREYLYGQCTKLQEDGKASLGF